MKKILLFATAAIMVVTVNAQKVVSKSSLPSLQSEKQVVKHQMLSAKQIDGKSLVKEKKEKSNFESLTL